MTTDPIPLGEPAQSDQTNHGAAAIAVDLVRMAREGDPEGGKVLGVFGLVIFEDGGHRILWGGDDAALKMYEKLGMLTMIRDEFSADMRS